MAIGSFGVAMGAVLGVAFALSMGAVLGAASALSKSDEPQEKEPEAGGRWNRLDLLDQLAAVGGSESRYDALASARGFARLQRSLEELRQLVLHDAASEQEAAEGLRMLLKVLAMAIDDTLHGDLRDPLFRKLDTRWRDVGAFNPDAEYDQTWIDGRYAYRLSGNLGSVPYVSLTVNGRSPDASSTLVGYLDDAAMRRFADADGDFTIWLTREKPAAPGGWIALPESASSVVIRQYVGDRRRQRLATFEIHAIDREAVPAEPMSDEQIAGRIAGIALNLAVNASWHRTLMPAALESPNRFLDRKAAAFGGNVANSENLYHLAYYELEADEALVIDFDPPETVFWNLTAASLWHETPRFLTDPVSLTNAEVTPRADGSVRFVLADRDPGLPNWLDRVGHERGFLILRMVGITEHPLPRVRRIAFEALKTLD
ncbi:MAG: DUF1214 domain-containing protein [Myxococcota bacterium]